MLPALAQETKKLRVAFLGARHSHFREKLKVVQESADFTLVGVCEQDGDVRKSVTAEVRWLTFDEVKAEADVVVVESGVRDHAMDARRALQAGKHVHVEKPPTATFADLKELLEIATDRKLVLQVGYMWRYHPGINAAIEAAQKGWLGKIFQVRATMNTLANAESRRAWAEFRGGSMFEQGCHLIDAVVRLMGKPRKVNYTLQFSGVSDDKLFDNTVAVLEYHQAMAIVTSASIQPNAGPQRFFEVLGTNGSARIQPLEPSSLVIELDKAAGPYAAGRQEVPLPAYRRYVAEFAALAAAVREGKPLPVSPKTELEIHETLLRACDML